MLEMPVVLFPGRAKLAISPAPTGSICPVMMIGVAGATCYAARVAAMVVTMIMLGLRSRSSKANAAKRV
jgi:hypothetical protein